MRLLIIRREIDSLADRTRDSWGDLLRRWRARSEQPGSLRDRAAFNAGLIRDWWATIRSEGGLWVRNGRPRALTHAAAALLLITATAAVTWQVATDSAARSENATRAGAPRRAPRLDTPKPIRALPASAPAAQRRR